MSSSRRWKIDGNLLPLKVHYFFQNAGTSVIWPFVPVIGRQLGISPFHVGLMLGVAALSVLIVKPLVKRINRRKTVFVVGLILVLVSLLSFTIFPKPGVISERPVQFECNSGSNYIKQCKDDMPKNPKLVCRSPVQLKLAENNHQNYHADHNADDEDVDDNGLYKFKTFLANVQNSSSNAIETSTTTIISGSQNIAKSRNISHPSLTNPAADNSSESATVQLEEACYVSCKNIDYSLLLQFCNTFQGPTSPPVCIILQNVAEAEAEETNDRKMLVTYELLQFEVKLKISESHKLNDCVHFPIDTISFKTDNKEVDEPNREMPTTTKAANSEQTSNEPDQLPLEKFSCLPNATILPNCVINCPNNTYGLNSYLEKFERIEHGFLPAEVIFWFYAIVLVLGFVSIAIVNSISDSFCSELVYDKPDQFGLQKLWGVFGYGLFCLMSGYFIDRISNGKITKDYSPCFFLLAGLFTLDLVISFKLEIKESPKYQSLWKDLHLVMRDPRIFLFMTDCVIMGICSGIHRTFLLWHVEDLNEKNGCAGVSDWIKLVQGAMVSVQCFSEILFFTNAGWLLNKFGYFNCMSFILFMSSIQFVMYFLLTHPWSFVPLELFQGAIYAIFYAALVNYGSVAVSLSGRQNSPKIKQFFGIAFNVIGISVGSILGGYLFEDFGGQTTFLIISGSCLVICCFHIAISYCLNRQIDYGHSIGSTEDTNNEQKLKRISRIGRNDSQEFHFEFESDID